MKTGADLRGEVVDLVAADNDVVENRVGARRGNNDSLYYVRYVVVLDRDVMLRGPICPKDKKAYPTVGLQRVVDEREVVTVSELESFEEVTVRRYTNILEDEVIYSDEGTVRRRYQLRSATATMMRAFAWWGISTLTSSAV